MSAGLKVLTPGLHTTVQDLGPDLDRRGSTPGAGAAIAGSRLDNDPGARVAGNCNGEVAAAAIDDDDLVDPIARHCGDDLADRPLLVEHRDDRRDAPPHRLQRTPHDAQAAGGASLSKARRNSW